MLEHYSEIIKVENFPKPYNDETNYPDLHFNDFSSQNYYGDKFHITSAKVIVIGDLSVGKSSLINRFCSHIFETSYKPTIGVDIQFKRLQICNSLFDLQIWDTAGQERFRSLALSYYRAARVIVTVFDLKNPKSLTNAERWIHEALSVQAGNKPLLFLVGSKMDLLEQDENLQGIHNLAVETSHRMKSEYWAVSSKTGKNVQELFIRIACLTFNIIMTENKGFKEKEIEIGTSLLNLKHTNDGRKHIEKCHIGTCGQ